MIPKEVQDFINQQSEAYPLLDETLRPVLKEFAEMGYNLRDNEDRWIEIKEGNPLPDYDEYVMWYDEAGNTHVDCLDKDGNPWMLNEVNEFEGWKMPKATHWRKLPKNPLPKQN